MFVDGVVEFFYIFVVFSLHVVVLSVAEGGVLKSPNTVIVDLFFSPFSSTSFCFTYFASLLGKCTLQVLCLLGGMAFIMMFSLLLK